MHVNANNYTNPEWTRVGFPGGSDCKESACNVGGLGSIPGLGRFPGGGDGNPFGCSCLENPTDRGTWQSMAHSVTKSLTPLFQLSLHSGGVHAYGSGGWRKTQAEKIF